jgi:membrane-associated phospholipid phosphatase
MIRVALLVVAIAVAVHVALGVALNGDALLPGDQFAFDAMSHIRSAAGVDVVKVFTNFASFPVALFAVAITALVIGRRDGRRGPALALVGGFVVVFVLVHLTKDWWDRPRPPGRLSDVVGKSYPSGHSAYVISFVACALALRSRRLVVAAVAFAMAIGLSRLYLHVHFLTDVLGGYALAVAVYAALLRP